MMAYKLTRSAAMVLWLALAVAPSPAQSAASVDLSGLDHFWRIERELSQGIQPSDSAWNALWATPGYEVLNRREQRRSLLTTAMRLGFDPTRRASADSAMAKNGWLAMVIPHLRDVASRRDSLQKVERSFASTAVFNDAMSRAQAFLPPGTTTRFPVPSVSLIYFIDARGYERILFDPAFLADLFSPASVLGHELHHYYVAKLASAGLPFGDDMVAWRIETTVTEGVAGLVDKREVPSLTGEQLRQRYRDPQRRKYFEDYQVEYARSNSWLARTDSLLRRVAASPDSTLALGRSLDALLPDNGRIMGAYMAETIMAELGHDALLTVVANPFEFWRRYNAAAKQSNGGAYVLSDEAIRAVDMEERRYRGGSPP